MATTMPATPTTMETPLPGYQGSVTGTADAQHSSGSIGTFFAVLVVVLVLTVLSCIFGRVCAEQTEGPDELYDCTRCAHRWRWWGPPRPAVGRGPKQAAEGDVPAALPPPEP